MSEGRDVAVVLSGGGMNAMLMEFGFLRRLRETMLWLRIGWFFGTSAGALSGCMAALDRLDQLEEFPSGCGPRRPSGRTGSGGCRCSGRTTTCCPRRSPSGWPIRPS